jgi:hypothetical protein
VAPVVEKINAYMILLGKSEGKRPLGRPRHRWEDNIRMVLSYVKDTAVGHSLLKFIHDNVN